MTLRANIYMYITVRMYRALNWGSCITCNSLDSIYYSAHSYRVELYFIRRLIHITIISVQHSFNRFISCSVSLSLSLRFSFSYLIACALYIRLFLFIFFIFFFLSNILCHLSVQLKYDEHALLQSNTLAGEYTFHNAINCSTSSSSG